MTFDALKSGVRIFIDANIFLYHFLARSGECRRLLERCLAGDVVGVTTTSVVAETMHRLMTMATVRRSSSFESVFVGERPLHGRTFRRSRKRRREIFFRMGRHTASGRFESLIFRRS